MSPPPGQSLEWSLIVAVSDPQVLETTLLRSPAIDGRCQVLPQYHHACAGKAYNAGIARANHEIMVFAHQDVYLPSGWVTKLEAALAQLEPMDPAWGVLGPVGVAWDQSIRGHVYSTGLRGAVGEPFSGLYEAATLDEMVLVLRRSSGLRFDECLPGFHLYGTDICLEARRRAMASYIVPAFCLHNSNGLARLPTPFWHAYLYLRDKWREHLPIETCCTRITRGCWPLIAKSTHDLLRAALRRRRVGVRCSDPEQLCHELAAIGYDS